MNCEVCWKPAPEGSWAHADCLERIARLVRESIAACDVRNPDAPGPLDRS